jgi:hypothetical protein
MPKFCPNYAVLWQSACNHYHACDCQGQQEYEDYFSQFFHKTAPRASRKKKK